MSNAKSIHENLIPTIGHFYKWEKETPNAIFLRQPYGDIWKERTFKEAGQEARKIATAINKLGMKPKSHIGLISKNCCHWIMADLAISIAGHVSVPFYASLNAEQLKEVIAKSDCKALFAGKLDDWDGKKEGVGKDLHVISFPQYPDQAVVDRGSRWEELLKINEPFADSPIPDLDELWTILFTSGTTGTPKGVMHTNRNAALVINNELTHNLLGTLDGPTRFFSFLPLNHIAERAAVELSAIGSGGSISFAESLDTFAKNLQGTQPTFFFAVPRIWTKFNLGVLSKMPQKKLDRLLSIPIVSSIIKGKIKKNLGLDKCRTHLTGASITPEPLKQWYRKLGINLREVYGMTENFGAFTLMPPTQHKPNTVGKPVLNAEGHIDAETGEIKMKMPWMMSGYYKDEALTKETIKDGWLHTGDKGKMDSEGFISIVGRVKDAFKTAKGEFIVPTEIEKKFGGNNFIEQICVAGLGMPQPLAIVCLSELGNKAGQQTITTEMSKRLVEVNKELQGHERIGAIVVAKDQWTDGNKMLTPTLKVRRGAIHDKYCDQMEDWCNCGDKVIFEP